MDSTARSVTELPAGDIPRAARKTMYLAAMLRDGLVSYPATVRDLSASGAQVEAPSLPAQDTVVTLVRGTREAPGILVRLDGHRGGIKFDQAIDIAAWLPSASGRRQMQVDQSVAQIREQIAADEAPRRRLSKFDPEYLGTRIASELDFIARKLRVLGNDLADDGLVICGHAARLQELDLSAEALGHLARLLSSDKPNDVLPTIGLEDLRRRLECQPLSGPIRAT